MNKFDRLAPEATTRSPNTDADERVLHLVTFARRPIPMKLMKDIKAQVEMVLPLLKRDESYILKELCDDVFWKALSRWQKTEAGRCMAYMVETGMLPLTLVGKTARNANQYRLS